MAARKPRVNPESTWRLYSALATAAGVSRPVRVEDPRVLVGCLRSGTGETAIFVNCSSDAVECVPLLAEGAGLDVDEHALTLEPYGIASATLSGADRGDAGDEAGAIAAEGRDARP
jgi:hypothetical protein